MVAPVPWFPSRWKKFGQYATFARVCRAEERHGLRIVHPRYPIIPKLGMNLTPHLMYRFLRPVLRRIIEQGYDPDLIDAHYFYPDGVAAAMLAKEIDGYIDAWIENGVDEQTYEQFRATLISKLAEQPENLWEAADRHWRDLLEGYSGFDSRDQLIAALTGLEYTQWWSLVRQTLHDANRRSLLVTVPGQWPSALPAGESRAVLDRAGVYSFD